MNNITISDEARSFARVITDMNKAAVLSNRNLSHPVYNDCLLHEIQLLLNKRDAEIRELRKDKERCIIFLRNFKCSGMIDEDEGKIESFLQALR